MKRILLVGILGFGVSLFFLWLIPRMTVTAMDESQIPTGSIATVTGTQVGAIATVLQNEQGFANLRAGPNTLGYDVVGVLLIGQQVPALGRSPGGNWIMVSYPGAPGGTAWVFSDLVEIKGSLPIVEPPPTSTPQTTPTLDPTLVAQFELDVQPTRLPTFTAPSPLVLPTVGSDGQQTISGRIPVALLIIGLGVLGLFGLLISMLRSR